MRCSRLFVADTSMLLYSRHESLADGAAIAPRGTRLSQRDLTVESYIWVLRFVTDIPTFLTPVATSRQQQRAAAMEASQKGGKVRAPPA